MSHCRTTPVLTGGLTRVGRGPDRRRGSPTGETEVLNEYFRPAKIER